MNEVDFGPFNVITLAADHAVPTHDIVAQTPDVADAAARPFNSLVKDLELCVDHKRPIKQRIALGAQHCVVNERVTGDR